MKIFISYSRRDSISYLPKIEKLISQCGAIPITERVDLTSKYGDEGIRSIIRDGFMADCDATIVLLSSNLWKRKHVDWEISTTLRATKANKRKGLITILMPDYPHEGVSYENNETPVRLIRNIKNGYSVVLKYNSIINNPQLMITGVNESISRSQKINPINNDPLRTRNYER